MVNRLLIPNGANEPEVMSNGKLAALKHQVELPGDLESERNSFAIFSLPKPDSTLTFNGEKLI